MLYRRSSLHIKMLRSMFAWFRFFSVLGVSLKMKMHQYLTLRPNMNGCIYHETKTFRMPLIKKKKFNHVELKMLIVALYFGRGGHHAHKDITSSLCDPEYIT